MSKYLRSALAALPWAFLAALPAAVLAQEQDTTMAGVTARVAFVQTVRGVTRVGILFRNGQDRAAQSSAAVDFSKLELIDAAANRKHFPMKDVDGRYLGGPISDWNGGGRWFPDLAPKSETLLWAMYEAIPAGTKLNVEVPLSGSFEQVTVADGGAPTRQVASSLPPFTATLRLAIRSAGQLRVQLLITNRGLRSLPSVPALMFAEVYALDAAGKRKYPLLKGADGLYVARPQSDTNGGGRYFLSEIGPNGQAPMSLTFQAPPDTVREIDIVIPLFAPLQGIPLLGEGGAAAGGVAVAGRSEALERALKELAATETAETITMQLAADVLFDFDKATLKPEALASLEKLATVIRAIHERRSPSRGTPTPRATMCTTSRCPSGARRLSPTGSPPTRGRSAVDYRRVAWAAPGRRRPMPSRTAPTTRLGAPRTAASRSSSTRAGRSGSASRWPISLLHDPPAAPAGNPVDLASAFLSRVFRQVAVAVPHQPPRRTAALVAARALGWRDSEPPRDHIGCGSL